MKTPVAEATRKKLVAQIAAAQKKADAARRTAKLAKLAHRQAKQKFKDAKHAAKKLRKVAKALRAELAALVKKSAAKKSAPKAAAKPAVKRTRSAAPAIHAPEPEAMVTPVDIAAASYEAPPATPGT